LRMRLLVSIIKSVCTGKKRVQLVWGVDGSNPSIIVLLAFIKGHAFPLTHAALAYTSGKVW